MTKIWISFYTGSTELHVLNIFNTTPLNRFYYHGYCCSGERCGPLASCFNYSGSYIRQISGKSFKLGHHASQISISQKILTHTLEGEGMVHLKKNQLVLCLWWLKSGLQCNSSTTVHVTLVSFVLFRFYNSKVVCNMHLEKVPHNQNLFTILKFRIVLYLYR